MYPKTEPFLSNFIRKLVQLLNVFHYINHIEQTIFIDCLMDAKWYRFSDQRF